MFAQRLNQRLFRWGYFDSFRPQPVFQPDGFAPEILLTTGIGRVLPHAAVAQVICERAPSPAFRVSAL